jgi:hypothetical protein
MQDRLTVNIAGSSLNGGEDVRLHTPRGRLLQNNLPGAILRALEENRWC